MRGRGQYDHPELRPLAERCIISFGSSAGPPMLPNYFYNNNYQIVQTKDHVMILVEMVHDIRTIRLGGDAIAATQAHSAVVRRLDRPMGRRHAGGRDDELPSAQVFRGASENLHVVERFTRTDADTILYKFTIDDPTTFTRPWSGRGSLQADGRVNL